MGEVEAAAAHEPAAVDKLRRHGPLLDATQLRAPSPFSGEASAAVGAGCGRPAWPGGVGPAASVV